MESVPSTLPIIGVESFDYPDGPIAAKNGGTFWDYKNFAPTAHTGTASTWDNMAAASQSPPGGSRHAQQLRETRIQWHTGIRRRGE